MFLFWNESEMSDEPLSHVLLLLMQMLLWQELPVKPDTANTLRGHIEPIGVRLLTLRRFRNKLKKCCRPERRVSLGRLCQTWRIPQYSLSLREN